MGFRFRKSFKVAPGVKLNIGKKSAGVSVGGKGFRTSVSSSGRKTTSVGVPGTGLSYVSSSGGSSKSKSSKGSANSMSSSKKGGCWLILVPIIIILVIISGIRSCVGGDNETTTVASATGIESFDFLNSESLELEVGESDRSYFTVEFDSDELSTDDIVFVSSDEAVATITFDKKVASSFIYYYVNAIGSGTTTVHVETADGLVKSEEITVTVADETIASAEPETEIETTTEKATEPITEDEKITTEIKSTTEKKVTTTKENKATQKPETTKKESGGEKPPATNKEYVLNTNTKKIHYGSCSSVEDILPENYAKTTDYDKAISQGYVPCKRCNP